MEWVAWISIEAHVWFRAISLGQWASSHDGGKRYGLNDPTSPWFFIVFCNGLEMFVWRLCTDDHIPGQWLFYSQEQSYSCASFRRGPYPTYISTKYRNTVYEKSWREELPTWFVEVKTGQSNIKPKKGGAHLVGWASYSGIFMSET